MEGVNIMNGIELIAQERAEQIEKHGYSLQNDVEYQDEFLAMAAVCYAIPASKQEIPDQGTGTVDVIENLWPFEPQYFKPTPDDRIKELAKAGALIAAEIDRLIVWKGAQGE